MDGEDMLREPMLVLEYCEGGDLRRALSLDCETVGGLAAWNRASGQ